MSTKTILSVGQCRPDTAAIGHFLTSNFDVKVLTADLPAETFEALKLETVSLVLINRKLDADYSEGMDILHTMKQTPATASIPVMLISNFAESQQEAVAAGALHGFGKADLNSPEAVERVRNIIG